MTSAMSSGLNPEQRFAEFDWETARRKLLSYFSRRGLVNAEDLTQETLTRIVKWLGEDHTIEGQDGFMKTVFGFARMVRLEDTKKARVSAEPLPGDLPAGTIATRGLNTQETIQVLRQILEKLPGKERDLILDWERGVPQEKMAADRNIPLSTLRVQLHRVREKIRRCYDSRRAETK
jgi:RNA polymerase sigma factor (sigma-70 family)